MSKQSYFKPVPGNIKATNIKIQSITILEMLEDNLFFLINKLHSSVVLIHVDVTLKMSIIKNIKSNGDTVWTSFTFGTSAMRSSTEEKKSQLLSPLSSVPFLLSFIHVKNMKERSLLLRSSSVQNKYN